MTKKFFMKASPKAAKGIMRVYRELGYEVHAKPQDNGDFVVVVVKRDSDLPGGNDARKTVRSRIPHHVAA